VAVEVVGVVGGVAAGVRLRLEAAKQEQPGQQRPQ